MLLDANMPDMDGFDGGRTDCRRRRAGRRAPIMMLTSSGQYGEAGRCARAGHRRVPDQAGRAGRVCSTPDPPGRSSGSASARHGVRRIAAADAAIAPSRILLAEDNVVNQRVAVGLLQKRGHHVTVAQQRPRGARGARRETFDLVLMDVQMPEMGGIEATVGDPGARSREPAATSASSR